jgi:hypothetical protein
MTRFKSFCTNPTVAAKNAVKAPNTKIMNKASEEYSIRGEHLIIKKTPAVTIVAAWMSTYWRRPFHSIR